MTEEIQQHLERSSHLLEVADDLYELSYFEDAVNRTYYAIQRSSHHALIAAFGQHVIKPGHIEQKYHRYLIEAFNARSEGDYFPLPEITEEQVRRLPGYA